VKPLGPGLFFVGARGLPLSADFRTWIRTKTSDPARAEMARPLYASHLGEVGAVSVP